MRLNTTPRAESPTPPATQAAPSPSSSPSHVQRKASLRGRDYATQLLALTPVPPEAAGPTGADVQRLDAIQNAFAGREDSVQLKASSSVGACVQRRVPEEHEAKNAKVPPKGKPTLYQIALAIMKEVQGNVWVVPDRTKYKTDGSGGVMGALLENPLRFIVSGLGTFYLLPNRVAHAPKDATAPKADELAALGETAMGLKVGNCYEQAAAAVTLARSKYGVPCTMLVQAGPDHTVAFLAPKAPPSDEPKTWPAAYAATVCYVDPWFGSAGVVQDFKMLGASSIVASY